MAAWGHCHMSGFFHIINCIMGRVCWPAISVSIDDGVFLLGCQTTDPFPGRLDSSSLVA